MLEEQPGWEVCGEAPTGRDAVGKAKHLKPDVVIMDLSMPDLNGLEAMRQILKASPKTEVLVLTIHKSEHLERELLAAGARGYILKSDDGRDVVTAVDSLRRHRPYFTTRVTNMVLETYLRTGIPAQPSEFERDPLSPREREILQLLAEGRSNKEVATALRISVKTVESHRKHLLSKLNLHSLSDLVRYAIRNKLVDP